MAAERPPVVLTIAGFDPSSGAGVSADIKTIAAHGCYGVACITAMTVQSTKGVRRVQNVDFRLVEDTLEELAADFEIAAIHIGMLGTAGIVQAVACFLENSSKPEVGPTNASMNKRRPSVVLDPVFRSSSGANLLDREGVKLLRTELLPLCHVITPNIDEAAELTGLKVTCIGEMKSAATSLHSMGAQALVITGGHLDKAIDLLSFRTNRGIEIEIFKAEKQRSNSTHGTGCAFSTALACQLALGRGLPEATLLAKTYVGAAIASGQAVGKGTGPVNHLYRLTQPRRAAG